MASTSGAQLKTTDGTKYILLNGKPVINPKSAEVVVPGLVPTHEDVPSADNFGESGDVFDHLLWRNVLAILWTFSKTRKYLLGLISMFCMRGKGIRVQHKGSAVVYNLPLPEIDDDERKRFKDILGNGLTYPLTINFPRESSKVPAAALTMERFKCVTRSYTVPEMLKEKRLTSVCSASGYEDLFKGFMIYLEVAAMASKATDKAKFTWPEGEPEFWNAYLTRLPVTTRRWFTAPAIAAGSISTKEVYPEDECAVAGTIYWTGINAMMTDAYNRIRAGSETLDIKTRLEKSAFYSDFKRKMAARNIHEVHSQDYIQFLDAASSLISRYLRRGSNMSADESRILDSILQNAKASAGTSVMSKSDDVVGIKLEGTTFDRMRQSLSEAVQALKQTTT